MWHWALTYSGETFLSNFTPLPPLPVHLTVWKEHIIEGMQNWGLGTPRPSYNPAVNEPGDSKRLGLSLSVTLVLYLWNKRNGLVVLKVSSSFKILWIPLSSISPSRSTLYSSLSPGRQSCLEHINGHPSPLVFGWVWPNRQHRQKERE